jgi:hypothetical protein
MFVTLPSTSLQSISNMDQQLDIQVPDPEISYPASLPEEQEQNQTQTQNQTQDADRAVSPVSAQ